jgi:radical SAM superfamily enzyme YgiQ (UPF0313 family)
MKCALIIPAWKPEDIFPGKTAASQINYWQPLGILYVASSLLKAGHEVRLFNGSFMSHEEILKQIRLYAPEFVGISSTTFSWQKTQKTALDIKQLNHKIFICAGGPYPTAMQEGCLEKAQGVDAVVIGEGEITVVEMVNNLQKGRGLKGVNGVVYRQDNKIIKNPPRALINDLDTIPFPARELLGDANRYIPPPATYRKKPVAVMLTSRGCNRRCIFCFQIDRHRTQGIRYRSVENVMQEIELCLKQGFKEIKFIDDTFAANYERAMQIAQEIKQHKLRFTWFVSACVDQVDKPLLKAFKEAGCWAILFGAESGVQKNLDTLKKGITIKQIQNAVDTAKQVGLMVITPFIFGIPGETFDEGLQTIEFACKLNPDIANFHAITPFPGTELFDEAERYGSISDELTDFTYQGIAFVPYTMSRSDIERLRLIAFRRFYSRPRVMLKRLLQTRSIEDIKANVKAIKSLFWLWAKNDLFCRG